MQPKQKSARTGIILKIAMMAGAVMASLPFWNAEGPNSTQKSEGPENSSSPHYSSGANPTALRESALRSVMQDGKFSESDDGGLRSVATNAPIEPAQGTVQGTNETKPRAKEYASTAGWDDLSDHAAGLSETDGSTGPEIGQQGAVKIPLRADPGVENLNRGEAVPDVDVRTMPPSKLEDEYRKLSSAREKEQYLAELMASERGNITKILAELFKAEIDPVVKESILAAAADGGQSSQLKGLLTAALSGEEAVDVRLAALYYASDHAPDLAGQYVDDANLDVREEARSLVEAQTNP